MGDLALTIGCARYDTTRALLDGRIGFTGIDPTMGIRGDPPGDLRAAGPRRVRRRGVRPDLTCGHSRPLAVRRPTCLPEPGLSGHSAVFVNAGSGIERPENLVDRTIGEFGTYGQDPGVWIKGVLMDEYGFDPAKNRWVIGGLDRPAAPFDFVPRPHPADVEVTVAPEGKALSAMLEAGNIDALFTANVPQCVLDAPRTCGGCSRTSSLSSATTTAAPGSSRSCTPWSSGGTFSTRTPSWPVRSTRASSMRRRTQPTSTACRRPTQTPTMVPWATTVVERNRDEFPEDSVALRGGPRCSAPDSPATRCCRSLGVGGPRRRSSKTVSRQTPWCWPMRSRTPSVR